MDNISEDFDLQSTQNRKKTLSFCIKKLEGDFGSYDILTYTAGRMAFMAIQLFEPSYVQVVSGPVSQIS